MLAIISGLSIIHSVDIDVRFCALSHAKLGVKRGFVRCREGPARRTRERASAL